MERLTTQEVETKSVSFVMLKPLGARDPLRAEIFRRLSEVADIEVCKRHTITAEEASALYYPSAHNEDGTARPHFHAIVNYLAGKEVDLWVVSGNCSVDELAANVNSVAGDWRPEETNHGQVRNLPIEMGFEYRMPVETPEGSNKYVYDNLMHSSDSMSAAQRELRIFFTEDELSSI